MIQIASLQSQTSRSTLIAAFRRVVAINGRRQATDLHVRRLLCYIRAKDADGQGAQRSLKQIANRLVLSVSTCRRVIRRAVKRFGLLIVIPQRHTPGGQSVNRYTINWHHVDTILGSNSFPGNTDVLVGSSDLSSGANTVILKTRARSKRIPPASESTSPGNTDMSVRLGPANAVSHMPVRLAPRRATTSRPPVAYDQALDHINCPCGSHPVVLRPRTRMTPQNRRFAYHYLKTLRRAMPRCRNYKCVNAHI